MKRVKLSSKTYVVEYEKNVITKITSWNLKNLEIIIAFN